MADVTPVLLIVEDELSLSDLYAQWFADEYDVRTASTGEEALDRLDESVDIVLLDRRIPGLSGDEVLTRVRDRKLDCRVAMVTAVEPDFDIIGLGFDDYLTKPVTKTDLRSVVEGLLRREKYDQTLQNYYALVTKRAALKTTKTASTLSADDRYQRLSARIQAYQADLDRTESGFDSEDFEAAFRDLGEELRGQELR